MKNLICPFLVGLIVLKLCVGLKVNEYCRILTYSYEAGSKPLYLMPPQDKNQSILNSNLMKWGIILGFKFRVIQVSPNCTADEQFNDLAITNILSKHYDVINLKVKIPYNVDIINESTGISVVGETYIEQKIENVCKNTTIKTYINDTEYETCEYKKNNNTVLYGKVISTGIKSYKLLYQILDVINGKYVAENEPYWKKYKEVSKKKPIKEHSIVICGADNGDVDYRRERFHKNLLVTINNCDNVNDFAEHNVLAVLTPKPFEKEEITYLPVVFYDDMTPYLLPNDKVIYPNSVTLYGNYFNEMALHLLQFLQFQSWYRVAIVSDNSQYSQDFEKIMTKLLDSNGFICAAQLCSEFKCSFVKALKWLKEANAKIIIANVDEKYIRNLVIIAKKYELTADDGVLWIFRGRPFHDFKQNDVHDLKEMLYFTVSPKILPASSRKKEKISIALSYLERAAYLRKDNDERTIVNDGLRNRSRSLVSDIEQLQKRHVPFIVYYVRKLSFKQSLFDTVVYDTSRSTSPKVQKLQRYRDHDCTWVNSRFDSMCKEMYLLLIMLVFLFFLLAVLCIIVFFRKCNPSRQNYRAF